ncbi:MULTISPECIES: hypothetical protein [Clostridium]|uniref:GPI inositol-deacylase PGAP1-like alpha/beta domain-containing protein n=1 Tax=Clostridium cibarium TaxID=2762247 RepID=A0ABR8PT22_9CLOT|nr:MULTISPECIES: hypothetical protein [Clostridium]MBD7911259.1 hypothetical protein [Clostridium cibarium]
MKVKKMLTIGFVFISFIILLVPHNAYAKQVTMKDIPELKVLIGKGHNNGTLGPIQIVPVNLMKDGTSSIPAYLITLSGTEFAPNQATDIWADLRSGFELDSPYIHAVVNAIMNDIPKNSNLIICGHSLGGMIAEQVSGKSTIKDNYNILNVVTLGSPLVNPFGREGTIRRLGDTADIVPYLSMSGTFLLPWQVIGLNRENGGYTNPMEAHNKSYLREDVWGRYDVLGFKDGKSYFLYDDSNIKFYKAPNE